MRGTIALIIHITTYTYLRPTFKMLTFSVSACVIKFNLSFFNTNTYFYNYLYNSDEQYFLIIFV